jgi:hypothetical protein
MPPTNGHRPAVAAAWVELRARIEGRLKDLNEEISHYPGPIARCDQHLAALIESRTALFARLQRIDELAAAVEEIDALLESEVDPAAAGGRPHELEAS